MSALSLFVCGLMVFGSLKIGTTSAKIDRAMPKNFGSRPPNPNSEAAPGKEDWKKTA